MKEFVKKHRIPIIVTAFLVVTALIVTGVLLVTKPRTTNDANSDGITTGENGTTTDENTTTSDSGEKITTKEWIIMFAEKFGLSSYMNEGPYFENVKADSNIFSYVQTMVENDILDVASESLKLDEEISQKSALIQLAKIYGETYIENRLEKENLTDDDYIKFATENIGLSLNAVEEGFSFSEATEAIDMTWEHYLAKEYGNFEKIQYTENVIDLSTVEDYVYESNTILVSSEQEITEGKVLVLATKDEYKSLFALKVTSVEKDGNNYILDVTEPTLDDIVVAMNIEFSQIANWDDFIPAEGVTVLDGKNVAASGDFDHTGSEKTFEVNFTDKKLTYSDEWEDIYGKLTLNGISTKNVNYFKDSKGNMMSKYKEGVEIVGKITIKDLIIKGYAEYDGNLEFNVEAGATISSSLSIKGKKEEQMIRVGELPIYTFGSPFSFVVDVYLVASLEGEIKVEPKVTAIASAKKTKNSGVNFTGDITTSDLNSTISGKVKLAVCPDAVVCIYGLADLMDLYIEAGVGSDAKYDLNDPGKIKIEIYAPTLKVGVGKDKKSILSGVLGIKYEVKIMDKKDALFKCPYIEELEFDIPAIIDFITGEETTTEAPTEPEIPTEPITEAPKPTEPVTKPSTQKPSEVPKPTEPVTEAPKPTEPALPQYELSTQTYEWAGGFGDNYYLVKVNGLYGVVDFNGNVKIPIQYEDYNSVGNGEYEFIIGNTAYIYNVDTCALILQYVIEEEIVNYEEYPSWNIESDNRITSCRIDYDGYDFIGKYVLYRDYSNGVLIEQVEYCLTCRYVSADESSSESNSNAATAPHIYTIYRFVLKNPKSGKVICTVFGRPFLEASWHGTWDGLARNYTNKIEENFALYSYDFIEDKTYIYVINKDGYTRKEVLSDEVMDALDVGSGSYSNGWIKMFLNAKMVNVNTLEIVDMPYDDVYTSEINSAYNWYYGYGKAYAIKTQNAQSYTLCIGNRKLADGYTGFSFNDKYIIAWTNDKCMYLDYNGKVLASYTDSSVMENGRALVYDGIGAFYINENLEKISDYVYKGNDILCNVNTLKINGKYHLIKQK